jgi:hypothetical protein
MVRKVGVESQVRCLIVVEVRSNLFVWSLRGRRQDPAAEGTSGDAIMCCGPNSSIALHSQKNSIVLSIHYYTVL